jgi:2-polyprenyl-3-methyl-5-hydroxy-6-metoxy-1,4-benzoquinol methylase
MTELREFSKSAARQKPSNIEKDPTIRFYNQHADDYANQTMFLDLADLYVPFRELVSSGRILDAGCGAGRDTRFFIESGYVVISFDASIEMVRKCQEYPHAYCIQRQFSEIAFKEEFDGVWACASLHHLSLEEAKSAVTKLSTALKPKGTMFISVKAGKGSSRKDGKYFQLYDDEGLKGLLAHDPRLKLLRMWHSTSPGPDGDGEIDWINVLVERRPHSISAVDA